MPLMDSHLGWRPSYGVIKPKDLSGVRQPWLRNSLGGACLASLAELGSNGYGYGGGAREDLSVKLSFEKIHSAPLWRKWN